MEYPVFVLQRIDSLGCADVSRQLQARRIGKKFVTFDRTAEGHAGRQLSSPLGKEPFESGGVVKLPFSEVPETP